MTNDTSKTEVSSPISTGGEGVFFEQHVAAYWLAQLLVRSIPPILTDAGVIEVHFQTEHLGFKTDDILVVCERATAVTAKLAMQVKRTFTISATDDECKKAIGDFWQDFKKATPFIPETDRLVLVTLRGTNVLLQNFAGLLDAARAAAGGEEFERRLSLKGFISSKSVHQCDELRKIVSDLEGTPVSAEDIWPFLRVMHVLSLDLHSSTSQTEAQIKTLLALKSATTDPVASATASWNSLLAFASTAAPTARSIRRDDLPPELLVAHEAVGVKEQRVLATLKDHTEFVLGKIRTTIGPDFHLDRAALVHRVLEAIENHQVVVVTGPAGSGKSAIGKEVATFLSRNCFTFGFRVEEFAEAHIDKTLNANQVRATAKELQAILAGQGRKLLVIESVERLLEKPTRDAFSDLMMLAQADSSFGILMTCRDYSIEQVRASFLQPAGIGHIVIEIPPLDDTELAAIQDAFPLLAVPLAKPALREILRNPYFIDKALGMPWAPDRPVPENERDFRALFWRQIVRADDRPAEGMPRRREQTLQEIAVRRARALSDYVKSTDLDAAAVNVLMQDSLITSPNAYPLLVATAHDVLEDWAILQWIEEQHLSDQTSFRALSLAIGPHPAIRRSYRKWVAELVDRNVAAADRLFALAIGQADVPAHFRDDTLVALLKAPAAPEFVARHEFALLANDRAVLKRVIHLLRVACVVAPTWFGGMRGQSSILNVPEGSAWGAVLRLVHRIIDSFTPDDCPMLLALIEDAVRGVSWWAPDLDGAEHVAGIAYWLLPLFRGFRSDDSRKRVLKVIARIPKADPVRFESVLRGRITEGERRDDVAEEFGEILLSGFDGIPVARDLPDLFLSVALDTLLASEDDLRASPYGERSLDVGLHFGIKEDLRSDFFPASAIRGPWTQLLSHHPRKGIDFLLKVFNHSADWYVRPRVRDPLEPAWEVELIFADGTTRKHWVNDRLWGLYRGFQVGPYALQCLLMALEKWLLDFVEAHPERLDDVLLEILRRSDSAALAAVVASVATAHPHRCGETLLVLLTVRDYVELDRDRMAAEYHGHGMSRLFPTLNVDHKIYEQERERSAELPHRRMDLQAAIANLQIGPLAPRVHAVLDRHLEALPPVAARDRGDLFWHLALCRMDLRQYEITASPREQEGAAALPADDEPSKNYILLEPKAPPPELQEVVDEGERTYRETNARLSVYLWGLQIFQRRSGSADSSRWSEEIAAAQAMDREAEQPDSAHNAPGFVAAVCVRDHWGEMSPEQKDWCVDVVCSEITRQAASWERIDRMQRFPMAANRPCAFVVPALLCKSLTETQTARVRDAFVAALTHPIDEVRWHAMQGIDESFWTANPAIALRAVNAIAAEAVAADEARHAENQHPYSRRRTPEQISAEAAHNTRQKFWGEGFADDAHVRLDISKGYGAEASVKILTMLGHVPANPRAVSAFTCASNALVDCWDSNRDRSTGRSRNFHREAATSDCIQRFVMLASAADAERVLQPILDAVDRHPREVHNVIQGLTSFEDSHQNTAHYWHLWSLFAERVKRATWLAYLNGEHPQGSEVLSTIFLTAWWKEGVRHWRSLDGYAHHVDQLFDALPPSWVVLDSFLRFLYYIGERSLPAAFVRLAGSLKRGNAPDMLRKSNTVFMLEVLLQRHVYARPLELKRDRELCEAVLFLLDTLVEAGSSAAFRMRDDFVTPAA